MRRIFIIAFIAALACDQPNPQADINCQTKHTEIGDVLVCETCIRLDGRTVCSATCDAERPCAVGEVCAFEACLPSCHDESCQLGQECRDVNGLDACWPE